MDILALIAAFGGGAFAASLGALPAFIMTGFVALVGTGITLAEGADILTGNLAFGSFFGPHIAFAGAAANAAVLSGNPIIGVVVAIACSLMGDFFTKTINSYVDTHIDPPACTIFIMEFIVFGLFR
ncbi:MAG: hypothetical protein SOT71_09025 [Romboutsia timonensis]|uniref:hypothetical protein n=1 Tax=Romboutsia timonensis TaxID=1776391 RepID=UPI002A76496F|nr:hypothetical protein [Romboutsia timonensis]MDY2882777.1 hypothetical protein [Romboutsia timonensis]